MILKFREYVHSFVYFLCIIFTIVAAAQIARGLPVGAVELSKSDALYVEGFADARGISVGEATERLRWQDQAAPLEEYILNENPEFYGGIWFGEDDDRLKIGTVDEKITYQKLRPELEKLQLTEAVDLVNVKYSLATLKKSLRTIETMVAGTDKSTEWPFGTALRTSENKLVLTRPSDDKKLSVEQMNVLEKVHIDYGDQVMTEISNTKAEALSCNDTYCDSPLRGGIRIKGSNDGYSSHICSAGFGVMGDSGAKYILTSGHCAEMGPGFGSFEDVLFPSLKKIGPKHNSAANLNMWPENHIDGLVIDINDEYGWDAVGKVYVRAGQGVSPYGGPSRNEEYDITSSTTSGQFENQRVCNSGGTTGSSCGPIKDVDVSITYTTGERSNQLVRAGLCMLGGDSGGPVFRNGQALGLNSAADNKGVSGEDCNLYRYYTGINAIIGEMNNDIHVY